ncbi:GntR family transcriptional regulator [Microbacterium sp. NPDC058345]|uniref:GntR family transcriptional regulator n=1 Tax=Microbacterium sp. NPDC058345 TaxID=3346455 RepID=UPI0036659073
MLLTIDPHGGRPLFEQVAASVRTAIAAGRIASGDRLPPAREIAAGLGINLHTVLRAFQDLRDEGLIELRRGRGAVITPAAGALTELHADITALVVRAAAMGLTPDTLAALVKEHPA